MHFSRKVFVKALAASDVTMDKDHAALAINLVVSLHRADRCREARRICRATLALYEDVGADWGRYKQLTALHAVLNIELGYMRQGLRDLHDTYPVLPEQLKRSFSGKLVESMLLSGLTPLEYAGAIGEDSTAKATALVRFAALVDDLPALARFHKAYGARDNRLIPEGGIWDTYSRGLTGKGNGLEEFEGAVNAERNRLAVRPTQEFAYMGCAAHLARAAGDDKRGRKWFEEAHETLSALDPQVTPQMMALALHHRNALVLYSGAKTGKSREYRTQAEEFFRHHHNQGYGAYAQFI